MSDFYEIVLLNDSYHSEGYIRDLLEENFPWLSESTIINLALVAATNERCVVFRGYIEHVEHFYEKLRGYRLELIEDTVLPPVMFDIVDPSGKVQRE